MSRYVTRVPIHAYKPDPDRHPLVGKLDIELTERCNNNCIHCCINRPAGDSAARDQELRTGEIERILREAAELGCLQMRYTGGEPLLREDFEHLYLCARKLGMRVMLFTNATLITARLADLFARIPPLVPIEVSVYGMRSASYEAISQVPGSFDRFRRGVDLLLDRKVPFVVKQALLPPNRDELEEFEAWAASIPWMDEPPGLSMHFWLRYRKDDPVKDARIRSLRAAPGDGVQMAARRRPRYRDEVEEFCSMFAGPAGAELFNCGAGSGGCVDAYGRLQPCMAMRSPELSYDLRNGTLRDASERVFPKLKDRKATNPDYLSRCARCRLKGLCEQCPAMSWLEHGTLDTPVEHLCQEAHAQARALGLVGIDQAGWEPYNRDADADRGNLL